MKEKIIRSFFKTKLQISKHSPEILLGLGLAGTVMGTVLACKATLKLQEIKEEKEELEKNIDEALRSVSKDKYSEEDAENDRKLVSLQTGIKVAKAYIPAVVVTGLSFASIIYGHRILKSRNVALAAAYTALHTGFKDYRKRVINKLGEAADKEFRYGAKVETIETAQNSGKSKKEKSLVIKTSNEISQYAVFFDECCTNYKKDSEYNLLYLKRQQDYANDLLRTRGHVFLNEIYDLLGVPRSRAGQIVGWIYDEKNPVGDNYIDFGIYNTYISNGEIKNNHDFVNGLEKSILLDFNVDGPIYQLIDNKFRERI